MRLTRTRRHPRDYSLVTMGDHAAESAPEPDTASTDHGTEHATGAPDGSAPVSASLQFAARLTQVTATPSTVVRANKRETRIPNS